MGVCEDGAAGGGEVRGRGKYKRHGFLYTAHAFVDDTPPPSFDDRFFFLSFFGTNTVPPKLFFFLFFNLFGGGEGGCFDKAGTLN